MKRKHWAIVLIVLAVVGWMMRFVRGPHIPNDLLMGIMNASVVMTFLCYVCAFVLCYDPKTKAVYYAMLVVQAIVVVVGIVPYMIIKDNPTSLPMWYMKFVIWYPYTIMGLMLLLAGIILYLELPKRVNWMMGMIVASNLAFLLRSGIYRLMRWINPYSPSKGIHNYTLPLVTIGLVMLGIYELVQIKNKRIEE